MNPFSNNYNLDHQITLYSPSNYRLTVQAVELSLTKQDLTFNNCYLIFKINSETYQQILTDSLFNLKPEARTNKADFQPSSDIFIKASVHPDPLTQIAKYLDSSNDKANYLLKLNIERPNHPLFFTENWFALKIKQLLSEGEISERTFWSYLDPKILSTDRLLEKDDIEQTMVQYFQNWAVENIPILEEDATESEVQQMAELIEEIADEQIEAIANNRTSELIGTIEQSILQWAKNTREEIEPNSTSNELLNITANYFQQLQWDFVVSEEDSTIEFVFSGDNGQWRCLIKTRERQSQLVFYSICPIIIPSNFRMAIAEFITLANYGIIIGNFELDLTDGELRYKTSIDVEGDRLKPANIESLIYPNLGTMDRYLLGIKAIIERIDISPSDAIEIVER